jgi:hypothetical protein
MLTFKQFIKEINDNPDQKAVKDQKVKAAREGMKAKTPAAKEFYERKRKAMSDLEEK